MLTDFNNSFSDTFVDEWQMKLDFKLCRLTSKLSPPYLAKSECRIIRKRSDVHEFQDEKLAVMLFDKIIFN